MAKTPQRTVITIGLAPGDTPWHGPIVGYLPTTGPWEGLPLPESTQAPSMFDRIGGTSTIELLVESFYRHMEILPQAQAILALHPADLGPTKRDLKRYLAEWTGGPALYSPEKGHPRMRRRHMHVPIGSAERDAWLLCMAHALNETVADEDARDEIFGLLAKLADWMRNRADDRARESRKRTTKWNCLSLFSKKDVALTVAIATF